MYSDIDDHFKFKTDTTLPVGLTETAARVLSLQILCYEQVKSK